MWTCDHCGGQTEDGFTICWTCRTPAGPPSAADLVIVSTTSTIAGHEIVEHYGPVFGETVWSANWLRDFAASLAESLGGRSTTYEELLQRGRAQAILEMNRVAVRMGANAVVGLDVKYESLDGTMYMICASGTAVRVDPTGTTVSEKPPVIPDAL